MNNQGFGANGVEKGTPAAQMHSDIGNVNKKTGFANAQSTGSRDGDLVAWWTHIANIGTKNLTKKDVFKILQEFYDEEELRRMFPGEESFDK